MDGWMDGFGRMELRRLVYDVFGLIDERRSLVRIMDIS